jgi:GTP-binding protein
MEITEAKYTGSFPTLELCPEAKLPEYAFIGRSNVGKSSLINLICDRKGLAHVSKKPGKTQAINFYLMDESWYLVDLPGYGYAKTGRKKRSAFSRMISDYILKRPTLQCAFVLIDANVPPQDLDVEFINWLGENQVPFVLVYTKIDRLTKNQLESNLAAIRTTLLESWTELPQEFITSSEHSIGKEEIFKFIKKVNKMALG